MMKNSRWNLLSLLIMTLLLSACGSFDNRDGPPSLESSNHLPLDITAIPDAVPRSEPLSKFGNPSSYEVNGKVYKVRQSSTGYIKRGIASWYGTKFHGKRTSSGEPYNMYAMSAAHKTLPLPTYAKVTNLNNGRSVVVKINDRGPFLDNRLIDLSYAAAVKLGITNSGTGLVEVKALDPRTNITASNHTTSKQGDISAKQSNGNLYVQVGAFSNHRNAERLLAQLTQAGIENIHISRTITSQNIIYRVRIGPLESVQNANNMSDKLANLGFTEQHIVVD